MRERPIIFNAEMVRAVLSGRKTQTRRIIKLDHERGMKNPVVRGKNGEASYVGYRLASTLCPFGAVGDRLWVRETWARYNIEQHNHDMAYRATAPDDWPKEGRWRPSIHMPRWASRITLEITGVRVERLTALSDDDARNEGCPAQFPHNPEDDHQARTWFRGLWSEIYGDDSWQANPWVWVIEFKRVEVE